MGEDERGMGRAARRADVQGVCGQPVLPTIHHRGTERSVWIRADARLPEREAAQQAGVDVACSGQALEWDGVWGGAELHDPIQPIHHRQHNSHWRLFECPCERDTFEQSEIRTSTTTTQSTIQFIFSI